MEAELSSAGRSIGEDELQTAFNLLLRAFSRAKELNQSVWEFAVEIQDLRTAGIVADTLRWLMLKGYASHRIERQARSSRTRQFRISRSLRFTERSCFVLTDSGAMVAGKLMRISLRVLDPGKGAVPTPHWDSEQRILTYRGAIVKHFIRPAPNQESVLTRFEELGWPCEIHDPLPGLKNAKQRLHDTIKKLNQRQIRKLIQFHGDGSGRRVRRQLLDQERLPVA